MNVRGTLISFRGGTVRNHSMYCDVFLITKKKKKKKRNDKSKMTVSEIHVDDPGRILAIRSWPENHSPASLTRRKLSARDTRIQRWTSPKLVRD